jgi:hypothetical protein
MALTAPKPEIDKDWQVGAVYNYFRRTYSFPKGAPSAGSLRSDMPKVGDIMPGCTAQGLAAPRVVDDPVVQNADTNLCEVTVTYRAYRART